MVTVGTKHKRLPCQYLKCIFLTSFPNITNHQNLTSDRSLQLFLKLRLAGRSGRQNKSETINNTTRAAQLSRYWVLANIRTIQGRDFFETPRRVKTIINDQVTSGDRATLFKSRYIRARLFLVMTRLKRLLIRPHSRNVLVKNINKTSLVFKSLQTLHCLRGGRKFPGLSSVWFISFVLSLRDIQWGKMRELFLPQHKSISYFSSDH